MEGAADILWNDAKTTFPDFKYTLNDIKYPTLDTVIAFSTCVLRELCIDIDNIFQPPELPRIQYAEVYKESLPWLKLFFTFKHIFPEHTSDYSVALFFEKRNTQGFQWIQTMSNFMQFVQWRLSETKIVIFAVNLQDWVKDVQLMHQKRDEMQEELNQRAMLRSSRLTYITELEQSNASMKSTIIAENLAQSEKFSAETSLITAEKQKLEEKTDQLIIKLNQANEQYKALQGQVVNSPEKLMSELADAKRHFSDLDKQLEQGKQRRMANTQQIRKLEQIRVEIESRKVRCAELGSQAKSLEALDNQLQGLIQSTACQSQASTNLRPELSLAMKKNERLSEELAALKLHMSQEEAALQKHLRNENLRFKQEVDERDQLIRQHSELETLCADYKAAITAHNKELKEIYLDFEETHRHFIENRDRNLEELFSNVIMRLNKNNDDPQM